MSKKGSTAWSSAVGKGRRDGGSSLTSDLLTPRRQSPAPNQSQSKKSKGQITPTNNELLKSHEVRKLEKLIDEVSTGVVDSRVANRPGCFCMARLQEELDVQQRKDAQKREEEMKIIAEAELARSGGGHFPTLNGQPDPKATQPTAPRKVLSLNSTTKKATISTFIAVPTPPISNPASGRGSPVEERVGAPTIVPLAVELVPELKLLLRQRPWVDLRDPTPMYQLEAPKLQPGDKQNPVGGGRGRGKGRKGGNNDRKEGVNAAGRVVPGASGSHTG